jgi:diacylglycerol kinase (ATP)
MLAVFDRVATGVAIAAPVSSKKETALDRMLRATLNSWRGLIAAAKTEAALREELIALVLAVPLAFVVASQPWKRLALIGVMLLLIAVELLNTAIEKLSDQVTTEQHPEIGRVKDISSAAVGVALLIAGVTWLLAFAEWFGLL